MMQIPLTLQFDSLFKLGLEGINPQTLHAMGGDIAEHLDSFRAKRQGFDHLPKLKAQVLAVKSLAERFKGRYKNIAVLGIGGSALGITCVRDALLGPYYNSHARKDSAAELERPRLFVLENLDLVEEFEKSADLEETLFIVISKSGRTPETMAEYFYFRSKVSKEQFVFITDAEKGELRPIGKRDGIPMLDIPDNVGGRFSVLSPVGLFPMALLGIDIERVIQIVA